MLSKRYILSGAAVGIFALLVFSPYMVALPSFEGASPEVGFYDVSPKGEEGGRIVPASCPSDLHDDPTYGQSCSAANSCGQRNYGSYQCAGVCSVSAPPNSECPASIPNSCGVQSYTTPGNYTLTAPAGVTYFNATIAGGGGGGGGAYMDGDAHGGHGGGSGGFYAPKNISVSGGQTINVSVGSAGCGGRYWLFGWDFGGGCSPYWWGTNGGNSSVTVVGTTYTATEGRGGGAAIIGGNDGAQGLPYGTRGGYGQTFSCNGGAGGVNGSGYGSGGRGGGCSGGQNGQAGEVIVEFGPCLFNYSLSNSGNSNVVAGNPVINQITATLLVAPTQSVSFSASGLPADTTYSFSPVSCNPTCSTDLMINTSFSTFPGTYRITVTGSPGSKTTSFDLNVSSPPPTFTVIPGNTDVRIRETVQLVAWYDPDGPGPQSAIDVTSSADWSSDNISVATVDNTTNKGLVTAGVNAGTANITANYGGVSGVASVNVTVPFIQRIREILPRF